MELKGGSEYQEGSSPVLSPSRTAHLSVVRSGGYGVWNRVVPAMLEKQLCCFGVGGNERWSFNRIKQFFKWSVAILPAGGSVLVGVHSIALCVLTVPWQPVCLGWKVSPGWSIYSTDSYSWKMPLKKWRGHGDLLACISNAPAQTCPSLHIHTWMGKEICCDSSGTVTGSKTTCCVNRPRHIGSVSWLGFCISK